MGSKSGMKEEHWEEKDEKGVEKDDTKTRKVRRKYTVGEKKKRNRLKEEMAAEGIE